MIGPLSFQGALVAALLFAPGPDGPDRLSPCRVEDASTEILHLEVQDGDNLARLFERAKLDKNYAATIRGALSRHKNLNHLRPGDVLQVRRTLDGGLEWLRYRIDVSQVLCAYKKDDGKFRAVAMPLPTRVELAMVRGTANPTMLDALTKAGEDPALATLVGSVFNRRVTKGAFSILVEKKMVEGTFVEYGDIHAAELKIDDKVERAFLFRWPDGLEGYYDEKGNPRLHGRLRAPLRASVVSPFGQRYHPIRRIHRWHYGLDYAAGHGAPIKSALGGVVHVATLKGHLGRMVEIRHGDGFATRYAHMSRFAKGIRRGKRIRAGTKIGFVGSTGMATGAHLHFETLINNQHVDPQRFLMTPAPDLTEDLEDAFRARVLELLGTLQLAPAAPTNT